MAVAFIPVYIRYVGIEAYGLVGLFVMFQAWLGLLDLGLTPMLSREMGRSSGGTVGPQAIRDLLRTVEWIVGGMAIVTSAIIAGLAPAIAGHWLRLESLDASTASLAIMTMGIVVALRLPEGMYRGGLVGLQRQVSLNVTLTALATIRALGAVAVLAWLSPTVEAFFLWNAGVSAAGVAVLAAATYRALDQGDRPARFSRDRLRATARYSLGMMGVTVLALLLTQVDKILLSRLLPLGQFGEYTLASTIAGAVYLPIAAITTALFPRLCELHARKDFPGFAATFHAGSSLVSVIAGGAAAVLITFADWFLEAWTGDPELAAGVTDLVRVLVFGTLLNGLMWMPYQAQLAYGWTGLAVRINAAAIALVVPAILWLVPSYGAIAAAWIWTGLNAGYVLVGVQLMYRSILTQERVHWYLRDIALPIGAAAAVSGSLRVLAHTAESSSSRIIVMTLGAVLAVMAAVVAAPDARRFLFVRGWKAPAEDGARG
jgi:O-antigen/teichoic acid export membrane protein